MLVLYIEQPKDNCKDIKLEIPYVLETMESHDTDILEQVLAGIANGQ